VGCDGRFSIPRNQAPDLSFDPAPNGPLYALCMTAVQHCANVCRWQLRASMKETSAQKKSCRDLLDGVAPRRRMRARAMRSLVAGLGCVLGLSAAGLGAWGCSGATTRHVADADKTGASGGLATGGSTVGRAGSGGVEQSPAAGAKAAPLTAQGD
jgi:hypothetical protein